MQEFSVQSAGFAALTLSDLMLQQLVISGHFTPAQARQLLATAIERHTGCAERDPANAALNITTAQLIQKLAVGLEPLFDQYDAPEGKAPVRTPSGKLTLLPIGPSKATAGQAAPATAAAPPVKSPSAPPAPAAMHNDVFAPADMVRKK